MISLCMYGRRCAEDRRRLVNTLSTPSFGDLLRQYRLTAALSQEALAERAGISVDAVRALERGRRAAPRPDTAARLIAALGLEGAGRAEFLAASTTHHSDIV